MKKILIIEDDIYLSEAYKMKLSDSGYEVTCVSDPEQAENTLSKENFDLILLDILMPKINGKDYLKKLKEGPYGNIPVIISSNLNDQNFIKMLKEMGALDYIVKSGIAIDDLIYKLNTYLED